MNASFKNLVSSALTAATAYGVAITGLQGHCKGDDATVVRAKLIGPVGEFYGVKVLASVGKGNASGSVKLDADAPKYEAARKALQRLTKDILGEKAKADGVTVPRAVQAAFDAAWAMAAKYEQAGKIAATALAKAKATAV